MREIILDTESTGLDPEKGHRLIEIGCVEFVNRLPTGKVFHTYLNPERDVPEEAFRIHKLSTEFLRDKPLFSEIHKDFLVFLGEDPLVIHNASFDLKFINAELQRMNLPFIPLSRATDTVLLARKKFPGSPANLDALCSRFKINISQRSSQGHGALLDAQLLSRVYIELLGGRQIELSIGKEKEREKESGVFLKNEQTVILPPRPHAPNLEEIEGHRKLCKKIKNPLWNLFNA